MAFREDLIGIIPSLKAFAFSLCGNRDTADDLVQEALIKAWDKQDKFEPGTHFKAWMFTILRNHYYSQHRKSKREVSMGEDPESFCDLHTFSPGEQDGVVDLKQAEKIIHKLPHRQREALRLVTIEGLSYEEAAEIMGCAVGTAKSRVNRARAKLEKRLNTFPKPTVLNGKSLPDANQAQSQKPRRGRKPRSAAIAKLPPETPETIIPATPAVLPTPPKLAPVWFTEAEIAERLCLPAKKVRSSLEKGKVGLNGTQRFDTEKNEFFVEAKGLPVLATHFGYVHSDTLAKDYIGVQRTAKQLQMETTKVVELFDDFRRQLQQKGYVTLGTPKQISFVLAFDSAQYTVRGFIPQSQIYLFNKINWQKKLSL